MRRSTVLTAAAALLLGCAAERPGNEAAEAASREIRERSAALFAAQTEGDLESTVGLFADDAVLHVGGSPDVSGITEIRAFYERVLGFLESADAVPVATHVALGNDLAYDLGRLTTTFGTGETAQRFDGRYLIVWRRHAETWKIAALALTSGPD